MEWADRQQFDAVHVSTPGPMGLCGLLVAKMLKASCIIATFHTDFTKYVERLTGDYRLTSATSGYMSWFYNQATTVFARSRSSIKTLEGLGIDAGRIALMPPSVDGEIFSPAHRDADRWHTLGVNEPHRVRYAGRVSVEKNLPMLVEAFKKVCADRRGCHSGHRRRRPLSAADAQGARPGFRVHYLGFQDDASSLRVLYASSDLLVFPSRTDTLGQVVMEAQASGLPVLVSDDGGPHEMMDEGLTGLVLPGTDAAKWSQEMQNLLDDAPRRLRMSRTAPTRMARFAPALSFDAFWEAHTKATMKVNVEEAKETTAGAAEASEQPVEV